MNSHDINHSRKVRNLVILIIAAVLILFVGIWAISSAVKSGNKDTNTSTAKTETAKVEQTNKTDSTITSPANQYNSGAVVTSDSTPTVIAGEDIPTTGPSSVLLSAIALGGIVYLLGLNVSLKKAA